MPSKTPEGGVKRGPQPNAVDPSYLNLAPKGCVSEIGNANRKYLRVPKKPTLLNLIPKRTHLFSDTYLSTFNIILHVI